MFFEIMVFALILGLVLGGKLTNLANLNLRYVYIIFLAYLIQVGIDFFAPRDLFWGYPYLHVSSYLLLFFAMYKNRSLPGMYLLLAGTALNFMVVALNGGQMPVRADVLSQEMLSTLAAGRGGTHGLLTDTTMLRFLGDVIYLPLPYQRQLISMGDILLGVGVAVLLFKGIRGKE